MDERPQSSGGVPARSEGVDWRAILADNAFFGELTAAEIDALLDARVSSERRAERAAVILEEGEAGDSIFFIGQGAVDVCLLREDGHRIPVARLPAGDVFGEMAAIEGKPRSATVVAAEDSVLLEIRGDAFLEMLRSHPYLEFKIILKLSERLRRLTDEVLVVKFKDLNQRFGVLRDQVKSELDATRSSIKAVEAMLEMAKQRASEIDIRARDVLEETSRSQARWFQAVKVVAAVGGVAAIALGALGYVKTEDVLVNLERVETAAREADTVADAAESAAREAEQALTLIKEQQTLALANIRTQQRQIDLFADHFKPFFYNNFIIDEVLVETINDGKYDQAEVILNALLETGDPRVSHSLYKTIGNQIIYDYSTRQRIARFLESKIDRINFQNQQQKFVYLYLLCVAYILDDERQRYEAVAVELKDMAEDYAGQASIADNLDPDVRNLIAPDAFRAALTAALQQRQFEALLVEWKERSATGDVPEDEALRLYDRVETDPAISAEVDGKVARSYARLREAWTLIP